MAGFNRNSRAGKRPFASPASSTTYSYYITTAIFLTLCIAGAWLLASTSIFPSHGSSSPHDQIARALSLSSFMQSDQSDDTVKDPGEMERDGGEGNGEEEKKDDEQVELPQTELQQNEEKKEEEQVELQQNEEKKDEEQAELPQTQSQQNDERTEEDPIHEDGANQTETADSDGGETTSKTNHEETEQQIKNEEDQNQDHEKKEKEKLKEESSLDGGMEEEQKRHEAATESQETETTDNESKEENKLFKNIEQVTEENQKETEEEKKDNENISNTEDERKETETDKWATQANQSEKEKERRAEKDEQNPQSESGGGDRPEENLDYDWKLCNETAGPDYIPCLDNIKAIKKLKPENYRHYEHRERHCPDEPPTCLVLVPKGYKRPVEWPKSRDKIWYNNVPHTKLAEVKGHQNWVKVTGQYLSFPGGGTQFIHGALHYIDFLQQSVRGLGWGKHTRVVLDVGCGVASFGGYLFERDVLTMSFAPKDEHEAQVQLALERGIPAISAVMGAHRLPFPSLVFDLVHCARCRVPWHADGGQLLLELNRVLRPGGYFVWSATPVYQKLEEDVEIWKAMKSLTKSMCWDLVTIKKDRLNGVGAAFFRKPTSNECYNERRHQNPPMCEQNDDPNAAWYVPMKTCMHQVPTNEIDRGTNWPQEWPKRVQTVPYWVNNTELGIYGKPTQDDFASDTKHWRNIVKNSYLNGFVIDWSRVRNVMDMRAIYGGFAAALRDEKVWVMNVVNIYSPDTLPIIYERGLFGIYHDWCESFSTYPRSYDLLHADHLFSKIRDRCPILPIIIEVDRIVRPGGKIIVRDDSSTIGEVETSLKSLHWNVHLTFLKDQDGMLYAEKSDWRPEHSVESS